jgi:hypothetical protein
VVILLAVRVLSPLSSVSPVLPVSLLLLAASAQPVSAREPWGRSWA